MFIDFCTSMCSTWHIQVMFNNTLLYGSYVSSDVSMTPITEILWGVTWLVAKQKMVVDPYNTGMKPIDDIICSLFIYICSLLVPVLFYISLPTLFLARRCRFNWTCHCSSSLICPSLESSPELLDLKDCASGQLQTGFTLHCASGPIAPCSQELSCHVTQFGTVK